MMYLLDTNIVSYLMRRNATVSERLAETARLNQQVKLSSIVYAELLFGVENAPSAKRRENLKLEIRALLALVPVLDWPATSAHHYAVARSSLKKIGKPIGDMDLLIAAHAISVDATLVTNNEREFKRIPGLKVENWLK